VRRFAFLKSARNGSRVDYRGASGHHGEGRGARISAGPNEETYTLSLMPNQDGLHIQDGSHRNDSVPAKKSTSVFIGFLSLLLLMTALVVYSSKQARNIGTDSAALRSQYRERGDLLDELRANIFRASTLMGNYLVEPNDAVAARQRGDLDVLQKRNEMILASYQRMVLASEKDSVLELSKSEQLYWQFVTPALQWNSAMRTKQGEAFLREFVIPHRNEVVSFMEQVNRIDRRDTDAEEAQVQALQLQFQRSVTTISFVCLLFGVGLAIVVLVHVRTLERNSILRMNELQAARVDLRRLSDRLVRAQEEERRNISRELHDEVGQSMSAMLMEFGRLESKLAGVDAYRKDLVSIRELAQSSVGKVRDLSLLLRPAMLDELGLVSALRWQVREVSRRTGLKVTIIADEAEEEQLPDAYRTCIYRVVQEALHNCVKHAHASRARVVMTRQDAGLTIAIHDDGVGFDPKREKGLGLLGIAERIDQLNGRLQIESHPGSGAVITIYFPSPLQSKNIEQKAGIA